ncbi:MAG: hypothetical protein K0U70_15540 [Actinomycetia bacterium]|nr:hypothetical protein [Actinomycetes bacterium]MCH9709590.1 hypothetical protein [Actinomycetes bacterium]MCH9769199.1 hypothetical protein [Actinomycetes bacterium]
MELPQPGASDSADNSYLAALDFSVAVDDPRETDLAVVLGEYPLPPASGESEQRGTRESFAHVDSRDFHDSAQARDDTATHMFGVTNPPGTVTVTALVDGSVHRIELSPKAITLTEEFLAEEVVVIAGLATQDARSAQYASMLEGMREHGHDNVATRDFLNRELGLPAPEQAHAARAELFRTRYAGEE